MVTSFVLNRSCSWSWVIKTEKYQWCGAGQVHVPYFYLLTAAHETINFINSYFLPFKFILTSFTVELTFRGRFKVEKTLHHCVCVKLNKLSSKVKRSIFTPHLSPSRPPFFPVWVKYLVNSCPLWPKQPSVPGLRVCLCELHSFTFLWNADGP